jgi:hypothetical protein
LKKNRIYCGILDEHDDFEEIVMEDNKLLVQKYPFLSVEKDYYERTWLDDMPCGWRYAFGELICSDIKEGLMKSGYLHDYKIEQIKEKFGELRWYDYGSAREVMETIDRYTCASRYICIECGKIKVPICNFGSYVSPYCEECFDILNKNYCESFEKLSKSKATPKEYKKCIVEQPIDYCEITTFKGGDVIKSKLMFDDIFRRTQKQMDKYDELYKSVPEDKKSFVEKCMTNCISIELAELLAKND